MYTAGFLNARKIFLLPHDILHGLKISCKSVSVDLQITGGRRNGDLTEFLSGLDIRDMDLDLGDEDALERVMDRVAVVRVCTGIDDDADQVFFIVGLLQPVNDRALVVALPALGCNAQLRSLCSFKRKD